MPERNFHEMVGVRWTEGKSVCVGLDSDPDKIPQPMGHFNFAIVDATSDLVCAYKLNTAFYESLGSFGVMALKATVSYIQAVAPDVPVIGDMKRGDIGNSNVGYAKSAFEYFGFDAITINPYPGMKALQTFLDYKDKGIFVLCRTSNEGSDEFQDLNVVVGDRLIPLYQYIAHRVASDWNKNGNCCLVVGATHPDELIKVRAIIGYKMPILVPGVGRQGGDLRKIIEAGEKNMIITASRSIIFASAGSDFAQAARKEVVKLQKEIDRYMGEL